MKLLTFREYTRRGHILSRKLLRNRSTYGPSLSRTISQLTNIYISSESNRAACIGFKSSSIRRVLLRFHTIRVFATIQFHTVDEYVSKRHSVHGSRVVLQIGVYSYRSDINKRLSRKNLVNGSYLARNSESMKSWRWQSNMSSQKRVHDTHYQGARVGNTLNNVYYFWVKCCDKTHN